MITKIGLRAPNDKCDIPIRTVINECTGMEAEVYHGEEHDYIIGVCHESVGLVTWSRGDSLAEAHDFLTSIEEAHEHGCPMTWGNRTPERYCQSAAA